MANNKSTAMLFDIVHNSIVDGPGIRTTVFFKGCNLACAWCHNPESQRPQKELLVYGSKCTGCGKCREVCPHGLSRCDLCGKCELYCPEEARKLCGREYTVSEVLSELEKDLDYYQTSGGGATFSGGECMLQIGFLEEILKACREHGISAAVDTAGNVPWSSFERILGDTDLFLYDIKTLDPEKHKRYTGASNDLILDNLRKLFEQGKRVWIRIPLIPGVNDSEGEMEEIKGYLLPYSPERVELLPYHSLGENKYAALGRERMRFTAPSKEETQRLQRIFDRKGEHEA